MIHKPEMPGSRFFSHKSGRPAGRIHFQLQILTGFSEPRALHMYLFQEGLRYDIMAENLGTRGGYVQTPEELRTAVGHSCDAAAKQGYSTPINCQGIRGFNVSKLCPPALGFAPGPGVGAMKH